MVRNRAKRGVANRTCGDGDWSRTGDEGEAGEGALPLRRAAEARSALVRDATESDMAAVRGIYAHYVLTSLATFEETPPTLEEMLSRRIVLVELGLPYLVAEAKGETVGFAYYFAYAAAYRARPA